MSSCTQVERIERRKGIALVACELFSLSCWKHLFANNTVLV